MQIKVALCNPFIFFYADFSLIEDFFLAISLIKQTIRRKEKVKGVERRHNFM